MIAIKSWSAHSGHHPCHLCARIDQLVGIIVNGMDRNGIDEIEVMADLCIGCLAIFIFDHNAEAWKLQEAVN